MPACGLAQGSDGYFYGTTGFFGAQDHGVVFQVAADGSFSIVGPVPATVSLSSGDGLNSVVQGTDGDLYVTAGALSGHNDFGSIFEMALDGSYSILYSFSRGADGYEPSYAGLVQGIGGDFYGATSYGGAYGHGTIFKLTPTGTLTTLVAFTGTNGAALGDFPYALLRAKDGNFYGTTMQGGAYGHGTVFKMIPDGTLTTLVSFDGTNGAWVQALIQAQDESFYGTTSGGGPDNHGTLFQVNSNGALTSLLSFSGTNGDQPVGLIQGTDGNLYGTTTYGGDSDNGTVFRITPAPPQILTATKSGPAFMLSWTSVVGRSYQLQFTTNLAASANAWTTLAGPITATNVSATASDIIGPDRQRFYRVVLLP